MHLSICRTTILQASKEKERSIKAIKHSVWKLPKNVAFKIASEASYIDFLIKNAKYGLMWKSDVWGQKVLPDRTKIGGKCQNWKSKNLMFEVEKCSQTGP